jgi:hypothetical protein
MIKPGLIAAMAAASLAACSGPSEPAEQEPRFVEAHNIQQLMEFVLEPQAQVFWRSSGYVVDEQGERDLTPTTDEGWLATRSAAATVTEMGNLLMTPLYAKDRGVDWMEFSEALVRIGIRAEQAAADKNGEAVFEVGGIMYQVCQSCHQIYVEPEAAAKAAKAAE